mmetsp:Transcript_58767/g.170489  ORF Transcript_58767/g.170489 Transcript_58767/m.170489 type:complete len:226 (+) Transcript_58767:450-1127(+)
MRSSSRRRPARPAIPRSCAAAASAASAVASRRASASRAACSSSFGAARRPRRTPRRAKRGAEVAGGHAEPRRIAAKAGAWREIPLTPCSACRSSGGTTAGGALAPSSRACSGNPRRAPRCRGCSRDANRACMPLVYMAEARQGAPFGAHVAVGFAPRAPRSAGPARPQPESRLSFMPASPSASAALSRPWSRRYVQHGRRNERFQGYNCAGLEDAGRFRDVLFVA